MSSQKIRVCVAGIAGNMGKETAKTILESEDLELVSGIGQKSAGKKIQEILPDTKMELTIASDLIIELNSKQIDVLIDFTHGEIAGQNALDAINQGVSPVIGASGIRDELIGEIRALSLSKGVPSMLVPNFAIGAVLMMKFSEIAAEWLPDVEIIEMHRAEKPDSPSGTAIKTAKLIGAKRNSSKNTANKENTSVKGVRGGSIDEVPVHSIRVKGILARQQVLFGAEGETLNIEHNSLHRSSFMEGVKLAIREVRNLNGFTYGLDKILFKK